LSGGTALVYEVVFLRMLGLVFGHTVHAVATVLIVFMGGLALGSALFGALTPRIRNAIQAYGWLELGIGAWAALLPMLFAWRARSARPAGIDLAPASESDADVREAPSRDVKPLGVRLTVVALGISGAVSMLYEVTWTRALALVLGSSTYAFTAMLVAFLLGLAGGSALYAWRWGTRQPSPVAFGALQAGIAVLVVPVLLMFERLPEL